MGPFRTEGVRESQGYRVESVHSREGIVPRVLTAERERDIYLMVRHLGYHEMNLDGWNLSQ